MKAFATIFFAAVLTAAAAAPLLQVKGRGDYESKRLYRLASSLNFTGQPMVPTWRIVALSPEDWQDYLTRYHLEGRDLYAFSLLGQNVTFMNPEYLFAEDDMVAGVLAHEAGHMICNCTSESKADEIGAQLRKH